MDMAYQYFNPNPKHKRTSDCVIRALSRVLEIEWEQAYILAVSEAFDTGDMPDTEPVWRGILKDMGFKTYLIPDTCPDCYTVSDFCLDHPTGKYVLAIVGRTNHVVAAVDGDWYDTWDSGAEVPVFYMRKE